MEGIADFASRDLLSSELVVIDETIFTPQVNGDEIYYHLEVPSEGNFYSVGYPEYVFISLLDGKTSLAQAITETARTLGSQALTQAEGLQTAKWLIENKIVRYSNSPSRASSREKKQPSVLQRFNPFWMKWSLGSPDQLFSALSILFSWLFSVPATIAGLLFILFGAASLVANWSVFSSSGNNVLAPHNWIYLILAWVLLKVVHELGHGIVCKQYGGEVRDSGLIFILCAPLAYVDVTTSWRFNSRWKRIHVAAAGMYVELMVAAVAAILLNQGGSPVYQNFLQNLIFMASISTLVFNANPLMRFDGYYILSDCLKIPNLAAEANQYFSGLLQQVFYGEKVQPLRVIGHRLWYVRIYSVASAFWRILICLSMITAASVLFDGAGIVLAMFGIVLWFVMPLWKLLASLQQRFYEAPVTLVRCAAISGVLALAMIGCWNWLPWPAEVSAPVVVEYSDLVRLRSETAGFIDKIHVSDGQHVHKGELLLELKNLELESELKELEIDLEKKESLYRIALDQRNSALAQVAKRNIQAAQVRLDETQRQYASLQVKAPATGKIIARNFDHLLGYYLKQGDEILAIGNEQSKELVLSIGQEDIEKVTAQVGQATQFRVSGSALQNGILERIDPRASSNVPHPALSAAYGGPLSISLNNNSTDRPQLDVPRFKGAIKLSTEISSSLGSGEQGHAMFGLREESVGEYLSVKIYYWFESLLRPSAA